MKPLHGTRLGTPAATLGLVLKAVAAFTVLSGALPSGGLAQTYIIQSELDGRCLDADANEPKGKQMGHVQTWECTDKYNQYWKWIPRDPPRLPPGEGQFMNVWTGTCLDYENMRSTANGTAVYLWPCQTGVNHTQMWYRDPIDSPVGVLKAIKVFGGATALDYDVWSEGNGGKLQLWTPANPPELQQLWRFTRVR